MTRLDSSLYAERRRRFMAELPQGAAALVMGSPPRVRSRDIDYTYRPDSDFYYLTGFREPHAVLLMVPGHDEHRTIVFVQPKDPAREIWDGRRLGVEAAPATLGVDAAYAITEIESVLPRYLTGVPSLYYGLGSYPEHDQMVLALLPRLGNRHVSKPGTLVDPGTILHEHRLRKDAHELALMRKAAEITVAAYGEAIRAIRPGGHEYEIHGLLEGAYRRMGGGGAAYGTIVAAGENATILHYTENDQPLKDGDLLLIDSGAEYGYYACDISRTFPVNGRFTDAQKAVYELVLKAQLESIPLLKVGHHVKEYHFKAVEVLTAGMVELGLLKGDVEQLIAEEAYRQYYMHGTGHYLGLDTHDVGAYKQGDQWRQIEAGMVFTTEPGLYIASGTPEIDPAFYGIGVRIEDDIVVTTTGNENLTDAVPKTVEAIEAAMRGAAVATAR
ncbi:MAG: aminopeptidase P N-terminal domain-containing protein [Candidatus Sericytochromatia bacterium]